MFNTRLLAYGEKLHFKGEVVVADPCYFEQLSKPHEKWSGFCDEMFKHGENHRGPFVFELNGHTCVTASTNYGDGFYPHFGAELIEQTSDGLGVDAGMLAIIPRAAVTELPCDYAIYDVDGIFHYENGNFYIEGAKNLQLITDGSDEEEEEEDDFWDDGEDDWDDGEEDSDDEDED